MLFIISLAVFSGRPDPSWNISSETHPQLCQELVMNPPKEDMPSILGYKGFTARQAGQPRSLKVYNGPETRDLQLKLLDTAPDELVNEGFKERVRGWITNN